jgi:pyrroloquinoline quinone (PQQ) biosynthesis protein C
MASLPGWMPILLDRINWGCATSPWFVDLADETKVRERGRQILFDLWPFIRDLPTNIAAVKAAVPSHMTAACNLLSQLSDNERHYQTLFKNQFPMAGLTLEQIEAYPINPDTKVLCDKMVEMCQHRTYVEGIYAIVAAEFVATMYCRQSLPSYEKYFERNHPEAADEGLAWVRLHAKTHTRHAIWMKRMLCDVEDSHGNEIPEGAEEILSAFMHVWKCPSEESRLPIPAETR